MVRVAVTPLRTSCSSLSFSTMLPAPIAGAFQSMAAEVVWRFAKARR